MLAGVLLVAQGGGQSRERGVMEGWPTHSSSVWSAAALSMIRGELARFRGPPLGTVGGVSQVAGNNRSRAWNHNNQPNPSTESSTARHQRSIRNQNLKFMYQIKIAHIKILYSSCRHPQIKKLCDKRRIFCLFFFVRWQTKKCILSQVFSVFVLLCVCSRVWWLCVWTDWQWNEKSGGTQSGDGEWVGDNEWHTVV